MLLEQTKNKPLIPFLEYQKWIKDKTFPDDSMLLRAYALPNLGMEIDLQGSWDRSGFEIYDLNWNKPRTFRLSVGIRRKGKSYGSYGFQIPLPPLLAIGDNILRHALLRVRWSLVAGNTYRRYRNLGHQNWEAAGSPSNRYHEYLGEAMKQPLDYL